MEKFYLKKKKKNRSFFLEMQSIRSVIYDLYHLIRLIQLAKRSVTFFFQFDFWTSLFPSTFFFGYRARCIASYAINCAQSKLSFRFFPLAPDHFSSPGFVTRIYSASSWFAFSFASPGKTERKGYRGKLKIDILKK